MSRQYYIHSCQFCNRTIQLESHHNDIDHLIEEHLAVCKHDALDKDKHSCSLTDCYIKQANKNICDHCTLNFCDSHKNEVDHSCNTVFSWDKASNNPIQQAPKKVIIENNYLKVQKNQKEELDKLRKEIAQNKQQQKIQEEKSFEELNSDLNILKQQSIYNQIKGNNQDHNNYNNNNNNNNNSNNNQNNNNNNNQNNNNNNNNNNSNNNNNNNNNYDNKINLEVDNSSSYITPPIKPVVTKKKLGLYSKAEQDQIEELKKIRGNRKLEYESDDISVCVTIILSNNDKLTAQFSKQDTLKKIQQFVNRNRSDGEEPYALCLNPTSQPLSRSDLDKTIQQLQLLPTPTLYVVLIKDLREQIKEVKRANDLKGYFLSNRYLEMAILAAAVFFAYYLYTNYQKETHRNYRDHRDHRRSRYDYQYDYDDAY
ncbi:hypothetical protein ACTFIU_002809 [Dictyostelium citrinum]